MAKRQTLICKYTVLKGCILHYQNEWIMILYSIPAYITSIYINQYVDINAYFICTPSPKLWRSMLCLQQQDAENPPPFFSPGISTMRPWTMTRTWMMSSNWAETLRPPKFLFSSTGNRKNSNSSLTVKFHDLLLQFHEFLIFRCICLKISNITWSSPLLLRRSTLMRSEVNRAALAEIHMDKRRASKSPPSQWHSFRHFQVAKKC